MENKVLIFAGLLALVVAFSLPAAATPATPVAGEMLPDISLAMPQDQIHRAYLGLQGGDAFKIPEIRADVVIIELFSMYCPYCQKEAPTINKLYEKIEGDPKLRNTVKIIGIGIGNSAYEVKHFRKTYDVPFPLFADGNFTIHKQLGEVRTPYFIGIRIQSDGSHTVFYSKLGGPRDAGLMLEELIKKSGLTE